MERKPGKNFRDIKQSIVKFTNENIPSTQQVDSGLNLEQACGEKLSFRKLSTLRNEPESFISPPKTLTINANPIEHIDFSSTKKRNKLLTYKPSQYQKNVEQKGAQLSRNDSTISNKSNASNEKRGQFNRFAQLAECSSKEKEVREMGLCFQRIASQQEGAKHMLISDSKSEVQYQNQARFALEPRKINFDQLVIKPKSPTSQAPSQCIGRTTSRGVAPTTEKEYCAPLQDRKESVESDYDKVNISQSIEDSLDMAPFI